MAGPVARSYKAGSIVYFENDNNPNEIYVLHSGRVILITTNVVTGEEEKEDIQRGEFFGVKSALGRYPREETAQVLGNSVVLVFSPQEFEVLSMRNIPLTMKMLRVFSKQLRNIHRQVREVLGEKEVRMPATELLNIGDYYFKTGRLDHAIYVYEKYSHYYPKGKYVERAQDMLARCRRGEAFPMNAPPLDSDHYQEEAANDAVTQFGQMSADSVSGEDNKENLTSILYEGVTAFAGNNYDEAVKKFRQVLAVDRVSGGDDLIAVQKAHYELGRTLLAMGDMNGSLEVLQTLLKKFPNAEQVKPGMLRIAEIYEQMGQQQKAVAFYKKVIEFGVNDGDSAKAKERLKKLTS